MEEKTEKLDINVFLKYIGQQTKELGAETIIFPTICVKIPNSELTVTFNRIAENVFAIVLSEGDLILLTEYCHNGVDAAINLFLFRIKSAIEGLEESHICNGYDCKCTKETQKNDC